MFKTWPKERPSATKVFRSETRDVRFNGSGRHPSLSSKYKIYLLDRCWLCEVKHNIAGKKSRLDVHAGSI